MSKRRNRKPQGTPAGGRFDTEARSESDVTLDAREQINASGLSYRDRVDALAMAGLKERSKPTALAVGDEVDLAEFVKAFPQKGSTAWTKDEFAEVASVTSTNSHTTITHQHGETVIPNWHDVEYLAHGDRPEELDEVDA